MADLLLHVVHALVRRDVDAQILRGFGLAKARDVVELALDSHQADAPHRLQVDELAAVHHLALGQLVLAEHLVDRLEIELGGQVHDRHVLVVELAMLFRRVAVAAHQMLVHLGMGGEVLVDVHRHEAGKLHEAGIDLPERARIGQRHPHDAVALEPFDAPVMGDLVDGGGRAARVDRAAHQRHGAGDVRVVLRLHQRHRRDHRNGRLAHAHHMGVGAKHPQHRGDVVDVVVKVEGGGGERHHPRIHPVGDVDLVIGQERLDRAAQQRGVVARHRRHHEHFRPGALMRLQRALEIDQLAEGAFPHHPLVDRDPLAADQGGVETEERLAVAARGPLEQFAGGRHRPPEGRVGQRIHRILECEMGGVGPGPRRAHHHVRRFIHVIG